MKTLTGGRELMTSGYLWQLTLENCFESSDNTLNYLVRLPAMSTCTPQTWVAQDFLSAGVREKLKN
jgi:hypothetical protein